MKQTEIFGMRISPEEKAMLANVAKHFDRTQAGAIKWLVKEKYQIIKAEKTKEQNANKSHK